MSTSAPLFNSGPRIMVVDDQDMICNLIQNLLETRGYRVATFDCGEAAVETRPEDIRQLDLLITDVRMPGVTGPELVREFRAIHPELAVIYISGYVGDVVLDPREAENTLFVNKPFKIPNLIEAVEALLEESGVRS